MVHFGEDFDVGRGAEFEQVVHLGLGHEGFEGAVPEVDVGAEDGFQLVGIDRFVAVQDGLAAAEGIGLFAFVQKNVEVVGMEDPAPESGPMVAGPDVGALVVAQWAHEPFRERQQGRRIHYGVVDGNLVAFHDAGEDLPAEGQAVGAVQAAAVLLFHMGNDLRRLVVDGGETREGSEGETIDLGGDDAELVFQQADEGQEDLIRHAQARDEQQGGRGFLSENLEIHYLRK